MLHCYISNTLRNNYLIDSIVVFIMSAKILILFETPIIFIKKRVATQNIFKLRLLTININYSIIQKILQTKLMNLHVLELSLATLGVKLHILVWSYREDEVGHGDATTIYEELN